MISTNAVAPYSPSMKRWIFAKQKDGVVKTFQQFQIPTKQKKTLRRESFC